MRGFQRIQLVATVLLDVSAALIFWNLALGVVSGSQHGPLAPVVSAFWRDWLMEKEKAACTPVKECKRRLTLQE
jgi:hypothetical protein